MSFPLVQNILKPEKKKNKKKTNKIKNKQKQKTKTKTKKKKTKTKTKTKTKQNKTLAYQNCMVYLFINDLFHSSLIMEKIYFIP